MAASGLTFRELLATPDVTEELELRGSFGFMAFHGGALEVTTDIIARTAAELSGASYYGVLHPPDVAHLSSTKFNPAESPTLQRFLDHVDTVITVHGYGRHGYWTSLLFGGTNRVLAAHVAGHVQERLPAYTHITDIGHIPEPLRGLHPANPVNRPSQGGVQLELPPRVRGRTPMFWDWEGPEPCPHTRSLIDGLVAAVASWPLRH